ncbi:hypothetical protein EDM68_03605 [Candidatus Uhrbacteria bacterium]|nr:MAG: hypothetical protein EDM68_03605 [Candidatus Uhrbacteria bacterium]
MFSCWCRDETTRVCNHHRIDSGVPVTTDFSVWPIRYAPRGLDGAISNPASVRTVVADMDITPARREEILGLCAARCAADGGKRSIHYETTYREEICEECVADPNSSCTEARGARLAFGEAQQEALIAACEERRSQSLLPMTLAVPIGGITQVAGLPDYINVAYRYLVTVVLVVAIVMVVYGGFRYLVGASIGDIQAGKKIIVDAIVGMLIVLGAHTILSTINPATTLLSFTPPEPVECRDLDLPAAIKNSRCTTDNQCGPGRRCVAGINYVFSVKKVAEAAEEGAETGSELGSFIGGEEIDVGTAAAAGGGAGFVLGGVGAVPGAILAGGGAMIWNLIPVDARKAAGAFVGETVGGQVGRDIGITTEIVQDVQNVRVCSTGEKGAPCLENAHCDLRQNVSCIDSWKICWTTSGNQPGEPCDSDAQCSNGSCVPVVPQSLVRRIAFASLEEADPRYPYKVCEIEVRDGTPCFRPNNGQSESVFPLLCNGPPLDTEFVCVYCPSGREGEARNWTVLEPGRPFPAQCKPRSVLTTPTPCAR